MFYKTHNAPNVSTLTFFLLIFFVLLMGCKFGNAETFFPGLPKRKGEAVTPLFCEKKVENKSCYVWFETNSRKSLDAFLLHVHEWYDVGNIIATGRIDNVKTVVKELIAARVPIIGGFKTSDTVSGAADFYNPHSWARVAAMARSLSELTDNRPVILENEGTIKRILQRGETSIDRKRLATILSHQNWPEIWFWHAPEGEKEPFMSLSYDMAQAVMEGIPRIRLIESSSAGYYRHKFYKSTGESNNLEKTIRIDKNPISIIYLDNHKRRFWTFKKTIQAIKQAAGNTVILYPMENFGNGRDVLQALHSVGTNTPQ